LRYVNDTQVIGIIEAIASFGGDRSISVGRVIPLAATRPDSDFVIRATLKLEVNEIAIYYNRLGVIVLIFRPIAYFVGKHSGYSVPTEAGAVARNGANGKPSYKNVASLAAAGRCKTAKAVAGKLINAAGSPHQYLVLRAKI
jgi:hypothetical protein